jgi:hypothetical protein
MNQRVTRVRILRVAYGADGKPTLFRGVVMSGAKVVASTSNVRDSAVCLCLAEALQSTYNVAQMAR